MTVSFESIRDLRSKWVTINRENGFEEGIRRLLTDLYPDNAHFIYELLQNAEDTGATTVRFVLSSNSVEFEHDGGRLFTLKDVEAITAISNSAKKDEPTKIGKFGVGFKAVFAYTSTPEIHSGEFHFKIRDIIVPERCHENVSLIKERKTHFIFPFDHPKKSAGESSSQIEKGLRNLGDNTLLFLGSIRKIEYLLEDGSLGCIERFDLADGVIEIRSRHPGAGDAKSNWLIFERVSEIEDDDGKVQACRVAIAYRLEQVDSGKKTDVRWKIVPLDRGQVSIYFPAEKETSNLRFHIHAPFSSTVARDSVRDCPANHQLRDVISELAVMSLERVKELGLLSVGFLAVLPNENDNVPEFYEPIRVAIVDAFRRRSLTPTKNGTFAPAESLFRGPVKISDVIADEDLRFFTKRENAQWIANPPQQNQREDKFLDSLEVEGWGWSELGELLHVFNESARRVLEEWLAPQDDARILRVYAVFGEAILEQEQYSFLDQAKIVRAVGPNGVSHVKPKEAFFPPSSGEAVPASVLLVKPETYSGGRSESQKRNAVNFLEHIGVRQFDARAQVEWKISRYRERKRSPEEAIVEMEYFDDLREFMSFFESSNSAPLMLSGAPFLIGENRMGDLEWVAPKQIFLDEPYMKTGLAEFRHIHGLRSLSRGYGTCFHDEELPTFVQFVVSVGAMVCLKVERVSTKENPERRSLRKDYNLPGVKWTNTAIDTDHSITGLSAYLESRSVAASRLIWSAIISADAASAKARFRPNKQYGIRECDSQLVVALRNSEWIPDSDGVLKKPSESRIDDLPSDFCYDNRNGLLAAIGFGDAIRQRDEGYRRQSDLAKEIGFPSLDAAQKVANLLKEGLVSLEEVMTLANRKTAVAQPEERVPNPERRRRGVLERKENAPAKESVKRERSIFLNDSEEAAEARAYLRNKYRNADGQMVCQCCQLEMPFKVNGEYYFEAVQCIRGLDRHHFENRLALCPTCAAMYKHAKESADEEIRQMIVDGAGEDGMGSQQISIKLAGNHFWLRFVGTHWFDLRTVLGK